MAHSSGVFRAFAIAAVTAASFLYVGCSDESPEGADVAADGVARDLRTGRDSGSDGAAGDIPDVATEIGGTDPPTADTDPEDVTPEISADSPVDRPEELGEGHCLDPPDAYTGTHLRDLDGDPIEVGDRLEVTVQLFATPAAADAALVEINTANLEIQEGTIRRNSAPFGGVGFPGGGTIELWLEALEPASFTFEAIVLSDTELITVFANVSLPEADCAIERSSSGALLQVIGGHFKLAFCVDMAQFRSLQVAPAIQPRNTGTYAEQNGVRDDLWVEGFIFCPQAPTIVHVAEFCIATGPAAIVLAGSYNNDADWEVDDFAYFEVFDDGARAADGFTTQTHPGGDSFWCAATESLMCTERCRAELIDLDADRSVEPLAEVSAVGERPRRFDDGDVAITGLFTEVGSDRTLRITMLDVGIEGRLDPDLYLVSLPAE
jgi:hypothetical protein